MKVAVFDTYVTKKSGEIMHFDILVPLGTEESQVHVFGQQYLRSKGLPDLPLSTQQCKFCHIEYASQEVIDKIDAMGFSILELEHC